MFCIIIHHLPTTLPILKYMLDVHDQDFSYHLHGAPKSDIWYGGDQLLPDEVIP